MPKTYATAVLVLSLFPLAANATSFEQMDADHDRSIVVAELKERASIFGSYDEDGDGTLSPDEMHRLTFHFWDRNDSSSIDRAEFIRPDDWDSGLGALDFTRLDGNDDDELSEAEFLGFNETGMYVSWDADASGSIDQDEFVNRLFELFDADGSGSLSTKEYSVIPAEL